jgi:hypothetical protein
MQTETSILEGAGAQGSALTRWGDYSAMTVDPVDDCTFYYTNQYIPANGTYNWKTRIASFRFPSCVAQAPDFVIGALPVSLSIQQGLSGTSTISSSVVSGAPGTVALSLSGLPSGATASFSPASVAAGSNATLTVNAGTAAPGTYALTVAGVASGVTHTATIAVTIVAPPAPDFIIGALPAGLSIPQGMSGSSTISTSVISGAPGTVGLSISGLPSGATASFSPASVVAGSNATLTVNAGTAAPGTYALTVSGLASGVTHTIKVSLTVLSAIATSSGDIPLPTWMLWLLGASLFSVMMRRSHSPH